MQTVNLMEPAVAKSKKPDKQPSSATGQDDRTDRVEFQAPKSWVEKLDAAAAALNLSRSAYIRMACNRQMKRDEGGAE